VFEGGFIGDATIVDLKSNGRFSRFPCISAKS
jgi:hypothetical protein